MIIFTEDAYSRNTGEVGHLQKKSFLRQCAVNLALAFIILSIYFITTDPSAQSIIARISTSPTFRGDVPLPGVGLMCQL